MKTKVKLNKPFSFQDTAIGKGSIGIVEKYTSSEAADFAIVIFGHRMVTVHIEDIDFVEFFSPCQSGGL